MGRIRQGSDVGKIKNLEHLQELCRLLSDPSLSAKQLNTLYAIRSAWAQRGFLLERELLIVRTDSTGEYISRASQRAAKREAQENPIESSVSFMSEEDLMASLQVTVEEEKKKTPVAKKGGK